MFFILALVTCFKLLLIPAYRSTDFEVHRNWLAITHNLPIKKWYFENTSEWTLDYPPMFACMYAIIKLFQRLSVIIADLIYAYGVQQCCLILPKSWQTNVILPVLLLANVGLLMVDHIHFQYNGIMFGILLLSITKMLKERYLWSAFWFTILLNMKHIFIYLAPAYFIYMLRNYCLKSNKAFSIGFTNFIKLASTVVSIFLITFIPFYDHINQVFSRMFPFKRGLSHAYWAPNIWALYNFCDKMAVLAGSRMNLHQINSTASMTGGLVQEYTHNVLPSITPVLTIGLTALLMIPGMLKLWKLERSPLNFLRFLIICALTSFLFGWHVHEKAILMAIIPLSILSIMDAEDARIFLILSTTGLYSLLPLLYPQNLLLLKVLLVVTYCSYAFYNLCNLYPLKKCERRLPLLNLSESIYILGLIPLFFYENIIHTLLQLNQKLPFLPLMMISTYCAVGIVYSWCRYYLNFMLKCK
ncbi:ALG6, ALG8 glycosyltransferase family [Popillia japonica]|uniref:Alpha-1,3-glucosyltransferase n=1 Tax=Popillia japonica TaxID=7064 RepID=A0AAW1M2C9_POPJA